MKHFDKVIDTQVLKRPLILLAVLLAFCISLVVSSYWFKLVHANTRNHISERLQSLQDTETKTRESGRIYKNFYGLYNDLNAIGFIGEERRLIWVEALRSASSKQKIYGIEYTISQQKPYADTLAVDQEQYLLHQSDMDIKLSLTHEGKLLTFLEQLEQDKKGVFDIQKCVLVASFGLTGIRAHEANVNAECRLKWYTLKPKPDDADVDTDIDLDIL